MDAIRTSGYSLIREKIEGDFIIIRYLSMIYFPAIRQIVMQYYRISFYRTLSHEIPIRKQTMNEF